MHRFIWPDLIVSDQQHTWLLQTNWEGMSPLFVSLTSLLSFTPTNTRSMWSWQLSRDTWGHCTSALTSMCLQRRKNITLVNYTLPVTHIKHSHSDTHSNIHTVTHIQTLKVTHTHNTHYIRKCMVTFIDTTSLEKAGYMIHPLEETWSHWSWGTWYSTPGTHSFCRVV